MNENEDKFVKSGTDEREFLIDREASRSFKKTLDLLSDYQNRVKESEN